MPEYLAPGVYIEEVSYRAKTIEGVSTSTCGFVGPARFGPVAGEPELLTSFADFERIYGGLDQLVFYDAGGNAQPAAPNYLAHAVRAFFEEGGKRLYVSRAYQARQTPYPPTGAAPATLLAGNQWSDGHARVTVPAGATSPANHVVLRARYPGGGGNVRVTFTVRTSQNVLAGVPRDPTNLTGPKDAVLRGAAPHDLVWIADLSSPVASPPGSGTLYWAEPYFDSAANRSTWRFHPESGAPLELTALNPDLDEVRIVTTDVDITFPGRIPRADFYQNLSFHPAHDRALSRSFGPDLTSRLQQLTIPFVFEPSSTALTGPEIAAILLGQVNPVTGQSILDVLGDPTAGVADHQLTLTLAGGNDGVRPAAADYEGLDGASDGLKSGLRALEDLEDISMVAAPGYSADGNSTYQADAAQIMRHLISHAERMRYRIAVLDSADGQAISEVRAYRSQVDSKYAALYYPWVTILDPLTGQELNLPPSGFVTGIYARNDVEKGVQKAPANEVVRLAIGFEFLLNKAQQDVLNPEGINCFRFFEGRGYRLWGARTISSDGEWKYVNLRRYFAYLERSIELGTQFAVFESNGDALWANVRRTIDDFLFNEWKSGRLLGLKPEEAYFVRCDRSTMTQNDIDNGRLICLIGVAALRPAEFVIFRIGQWTADRRS
ncbi:MAG: phage tail sheath subtilisin-like domain-containing protein [Anaerolineales bacterium]|nr:phage tail sheath subtilisin-like domain-containing protein [Anaerolineales bacterium]